MGIIAKITLDMKYEKLIVSGVWSDGVQWDFFISETLPEDIPSVSVCGLYIRDNSILLTNNHRGWDLTGGHIEVGESIEETLAREMLEEGGVIISDSRLIGYKLVKYQPNTLNKTTGASYPSMALIPFFLVQTDKDLVAVDGDECTEARFFKFGSKEVENLGYTGLLHEIIKNL
ncbi:NUDIX domain-containing protein [bacterium]|nr:NUDIX domain-containing protein [bacterium]